MAENLDRRLKGSESIALVVRGPRQPVTKPLKSVRQVVSVQAKSDGRPGSGEVQAFTVETEMGADIREAPASVVVNAGFGLLELRPAHLSLEEIFLQLTTSDSASESDAEAAA